MEVGATEPPTQEVQLPEPQRWVPTIANAAHQSSLLLLRAEGPADDGIFVVRNVQKLLRSQAANCRQTWKR
jgi:hypothetical protein